MKNLLLGIICLFDISIQAMEEMPLELPDEIASAREELPAGTGWLITNTADVALTLGWYGTKFGGITSYSYGNKTLLSPCITLEPGDHVALKDPKKLPKGYRRELCLSVNRDLLGETIECDASGKMKQAGIIVKSHAELGASAPFQSQTLKRLFVLQTLGSETLELKDVQGWTIQNKADQDLYGAWYIKTSQGLKRIESQEMWALRASARLFVALPDRPFQDQNFYGGGPQRQFLVAGEPAILAEHLGNILPDGVAAFSKHDLGRAYGTCTLLYENGLPGLHVFSNAISLLNATSIDLYCSVYILDEALEKAERYTPIKLIPSIQPHLSCHVQLPPRVDRSRILLILSHEKEEVSLDTLSKNQWRTMIHKTFASSNLYDYYCGIYDITCDADQSYTVKGQGGGLSGAMARRIGDINPFHEDELHHLEKSAQHALRVERPALDKVCRGSTLNTEAFAGEEAFLKDRDNIVRNAINTFLNDPECTLADDETPPRVALIFSGGGYRAMVNTIGYLRGADNDEGGKVFDCCSYMMGLSGSTWAINTLVASGKTPKEFAELQRAKLGKTLIELYFDLINDSVPYRNRKFMQSRCNQYTGLVGNYGHALGNALLDGYTVNGHKTHDITLSDLQEHLSHGEYPLPISVATDAPHDPRLRTWYEFSPYAIGTAQHGGGWVDSHLFGSLFHNGKLVDQKPEYPLAYYFGIWGSAFALTPDDIAKVSTVGGLAAQATTAMGNAAQFIYQKVITKTAPEKTSTDRFTCATLPNIFYKIPAPSLGALKDDQTIDLIDAGINKDHHRHNLATVPALWRNVDVLIICDSVDKPNSDEVGHLRASEDEARRLNLPFPTISQGYEAAATLHDLTHQVATLIKPTKEGEPLIVYMTSKRNHAYDEKLTGKGSSYLRAKGFDPDASALFRGQKNFTQTLNFKYTPEHYDLLTGLTEEIFIQSKEQIKEAIKQAIKLNRE